MAQKTEFILLSTTRTGDKSVVLHTLSRDLGRRSFIVSTGGKVPSALLQPLTIIDAEAIENPKSDLWRLRNLQAVEPLFSLRSDLHKASISMFMAEVLYRVVREDVFEQPLYDWARKQILLLDALQSDFSNFHIRFLLELATALGYDPSAESLAPLAGEHLAALSTFVQAPFARAMLLPLTGKQRSSIAETLVRYISVHCGCRIELRSLRVLHELYL